MLEALKPKITNFIRTKNIFNPKKESIEDWNGENIREKERERSWKLNKLSHMNLLVCTWDLVGAGGW